jgi:G:T-mismatch repair DNA endonuclease (very short patch repair protein)
MARNEDLVRRDCTVCGDSYFARRSRLRWGRETTCTRKCSYVARAQDKERTVIATCPVCGKDVRRTPAQIKGKYGVTFCSPECHYAGRSLGLTRRLVTQPYKISAAGRAAWKVGAQKTAATRRKGDNYVKSEATIAKLSEATARQLARCQGTFAPSHIENKVADELTALGVCFVRQHILRDDGGRFCAVADFWLIDAAGVIEVNGTYWHCDPRAYPAGPINAMQSRCVAKYRRKLELYERLGMRVGEVWEMDLKQEPREAVLRAYLRASAR